jgi:phenylacetic acid degradation operon negative regulatory protein
VNARTDGAPALAGVVPRPQSLMFSFLGIYVLGRDTAVSAGSIISVLGRAGMSEDAVRSTLTRMVGRDLLQRHRRGRQAYFGLTPRSDAVLRDGQARVWQIGAVNRDWDGTWTVLGFSLPEPWRRERHVLRSRLIWNGFGLLQNGMWISPSTVDISALLHGLDLDTYVRVFTARSAEPTRDAELVRAAFDVPKIAARYHSFLSRWQGQGPPADTPDDLARQLLLHADWLQVIRHDPRLPVCHLPADWPAIRAELIFRDMATASDWLARPIADALLDTIAAGPAPATARPDEGSPLLPSSVQATP